MHVFLGVREKGGGEGGGGVEKIRELISFKGRLWLTYKVWHTGTSHKLQYTEKSLIVKHVNLKHDEKTYVSTSTGQEPSENKKTFNSLVAFGYS